ncbi:TetR/AcrR family transcriptional regulator [Nocardia noduli]|uniref:TetR/AcrR family transcriptional regulator n=1 Tax=Nocardia noduli TaxID=2815722 RepID=UPI001C23F8DC|nr:TetR/AcrR family transcriptional regulator [Nocardia noduli]
MTEARTTPYGREAQRLRTRRRVLDAALAEFRRTGAAAADVGAIVADAGVARATFYFHFPRKEHVLLELERREEVRIAKRLAHRLAEPHDLAAALDEVVRSVLTVERRVGSVLFKDLLALHFSPNRPEDDEWTDHPVIVLVVEEFARARDDGEAFAGLNPFHAAVFFLLGLYALLTTSGESRSTRAVMLDNYVALTLRGMEIR